jgi:hypothetical protein
MAKPRQIVVANAAALLALAACGGASTKGSGSSGGTAGTKPVPGVGGSSALAGAPTSTAGQATGGTGASLGGAAPVGGSDGGAALDGGVSGIGGEVGEAGAPNCPAIPCTMKCPGERWLGLDDCSTCACAPPAPQLTHEGWSCPDESLTVQAASSYVIGGYNRWIIDFEWTCGAVSAGGPSRAKLEIGLVEPPPVLVDATNRTFYWSQSESLEEFELRGATIWLRGSGVPEIEVPLNASSAFLSIRREGDEWVGGVHYVGNDSMHAHLTTLAGPFRVPVPTENSAR